MNLIYKKKLLFFMGFSKDFRIDILDSYLDFNESPIDYSPENDFTESSGQIIGYTGNNIEIVIPLSIGLINIISIANNTFEGCVADSITLSDNIISIGNSVCKDSLNLFYIYISASVTSIGSAIFENCPMLTIIKVSGYNTNFIAIDNILYEL